MDQQKHFARQAKLVDYFHSAPISRSTGMRMAYNENGEAVFTMPYNPNFDHAMHDVHGGIVATMIDNAGWFTVAPHYEFWIATVEFSTRLLEPVQKSDLVSVGKLVRRGKTLSVCNMEVKNTQGRLIATGAGTFMATTIPLPTV